MSVPRMKSSLHWIIIGLLDAALEQANPESRGTTPPNDRGTHD